MIHDARSQYGRNTVNSALMRPANPINMTPSNYLQQQIQEKRNRKIENAIRERREIQKTYEENPFVKKKRNGMSSNAARNPERKTRPVIGNRHAETPSSHPGNPASHDDLFGNDNVDTPSHPAASKPDLFGNNNRDLSIHIENDNFKDVPSSKGFSAASVEAAHGNGSQKKSKRDLIWERKRQEKLRRMKGADRSSVPSPPSTAPTHSPTARSRVTKKFSPASSPHLNETTRDKIYRQKRERFLREQERKMGKRNDISPTHDDLYNFSASPPSPSQRKNNSATNKNNLFGNEDDRMGPPIEEIGRGGALEVPSSHDLRQQQERSRSPTQQWNDIASRPPLHSTHGKQRRNSIPSPPSGRNYDHHGSPRSRYPVDHSPVRKSPYRSNSSPSLNSPSGGGLFGKLGEQSNKPKQKFNHDIPVDPKTFSSKDPKNRLIHKNERSGGLFGGLGNNNDQQRYVSQRHQHSPVTNQNYRPAPPSGRPAYLSPAKRHSMPSPLSPQQQYGLSIEDERRKKQLKQQEYAKALQEQINNKEKDRFSRARRNSAPQSPAHRPQYQEHNRRRSPSVGAAPSRQFNQQPYPASPYRSPGAPSAVPHSPFHAPGSPRHIQGPSQQIGMSVQDEKRQKLLKQQEYNRQLQEQIRLKQEAQQKERQEAANRRRYSEKRGPPPAAERHYEQPARQENAFRDARHRTPPRNNPQYSEYPSPSHYVDRVPMRHDAPPDNVPRKISSNDLRSDRERRNDANKKQEYAQFLRQQMEEKKKREEQQRREREAADMRHERASGVDHQQAPPPRNEAPHNPSHEAPAQNYRDDQANQRMAGFDRIASSDNSEQKRDLFGPSSPQKQMGPPIRNVYDDNDTHAPPAGPLSPSHPSSPSNAHRGLLRYAEPAAVEEKRKRLEKQRLLKEQLQQQMKEKEEKEKAEKLRREQEEERERLRFEKEQAELKKQQEEEEIQKKKKAQEEEEARMQAEQEKQQRAEDEKRKEEEAERRFQQQQQQAAPSSSPTSGAAKRNDLFGNDEHEEVAFPQQQQQARGPPLGEMQQQDQPAEAAPSQPVSHQRRPSHHNVVGPSELHDDDEPVRQKFQQLQNKIDQYTDKEDANALREQVQQLQQRIDMMEQQKGVPSQQSQVSTPASSRRLITPADIDEQPVAAALHRQHTSPSQAEHHSPKSVHKSTDRTAVSPTPNQAKSPKKLTTTKRLIPTTGRSEMMSVAASRAFGQSIDAESEFLFPTPMSARRSTASLRPSSRHSNASSQYIYHTSGGLEHDEDDSESIYRPDTARSDVSDASTINTERLAKRNQHRVSQLERLESVDNDAEKEKLMERYLTTGRMQTPPRPDTGYSLPGTSEAVMPSQQQEKSNNRSSKRSSLPSILDDPFEDAEADVPGVYKRLNSAKSRASDLSEPQRPDTADSLASSVRPSSRHSTRSRSSHRRRPSSRHGRRRSLSTPRYPVTKDESGNDAETASRGTRRSRPRRPSSNRRRSRPSSARKHRPMVEQSLSSQSKFVMHPDMEYDDE